jgi:diguanylate cyclase (GGDEF)-like protein
VRIRSLALAYVLGVGLVAVGSAAFVWSYTWHRLSEAQEAGALVNVLKPTVKFVEAFSLERGVYNQVLVSKVTGERDARRLVAEREAVTDPLFAEALRGSAELPEPLRSEFIGPISKAWTIIRNARAAAQPLLSDLIPASPEAAKVMVDRLAEASAQIDLALGEAERTLADIDPSLASMLEISRLSNDIREQAGMRSVLISRFAGTGKAFTIAERVQAAQATGAVNITWQRLQRIAAQVGDATIQDAVARVKSGFFDEGEPVYKTMLDAARDGSKPPFDFLAWRAWTVAKLTESLAARDAPIEQAAGRVRMLRDEAIRAFAYGLAGVGVLFLILIAVGVLVETRVLRPIERLTNALDEFASAKGDAPSLRRKAEDLESRYGDRQDEIGSLSRAVSRFRDYANLLERLNQRFNTVLANLPQGVCFYDERDRLVVANRRYAELYGVPPDTELAGRSLAEVMALRKVVAEGSCEGADDTLRESLADLSTGEVAKCIAELPNGRVLSLSGVRMPGGGWLATHLDITERCRAEAQLAFMADHDALTGLANRGLLARTMASALDRVRCGQQLAVMWLDLDRFKMVNDTLGHARGDDLLKQVALRLRACVRPTDIVARLGGDEFAVVLEAAEVSLNALAERMLSAVGQPYDLDGHTVTVGASIGIAVGPQDGASAAELLKAADMAMYRAKSDGRGSLQFFEPAMDAAMQLRRMLEIDLRNALQRGEFELHYQPILDLAQSAITSFEALLRWNHPTRGRISPMDFIPLAEESGLIVNIGSWVLHEACAEASNWPKSIKVSVNLSPRQFNSGRLFADIVAALRDSRLPPDRLELEITELAMLANDQATVAILHDLRKLGIAIAMDDFGTGYSSISYLRRFPFDKIKIDQTFVRDLARDPESIAIIRAVVELGAGLHMTTTAEGVETQAQLELLKAEGCDAIQGFLISRPVPASEIPRLLGEPWAMAVA